MVSRETKVQFVVATIAMASLVGVQVLVPDPPWWLLVLGGLVFYGLIFGGTHAYFLLRGDTEGVALTARKRFLALLAALLVLIPLAFVAGPQRIGPLQLRPAVTAVILGVVVWYFVAEGRAGYRATMLED